MLHLLINYEILIRLRCVDSYFEMKYNYLKIYVIIVKLFYNLNINFKPTFVGIARRQFNDNRILHAVMSSKNSYNK